MLARDLAARGMLIVSGMARGIDSAAHKGALAAGKPTLAVWGTGADVIYPKENKKLAEDILATGGAIVSELPLGTFPAPQNFPRRNRILSGCERGGAGGGGERELRDAGDGAVRGGPGAGCFCGAGECDEQKFLDAEYADQAGRAADGDLGGCVGGAVVAGAAGAGGGVGG